MNYLSPVWIGADLSQIGNGHANSHLGFFQWNFIYMGCCSELLFFFLKKYDTHIRPDSSTRLISGITQVSLYGIKGQSMEKN